MQRLIPETDAALAAVLTTPHGDAEKLFSTSWPRRAFQQMDYAFHFDLTNTDRKQESAARTEAGFIFIATSISAMWDTNSTVAAKWSPPKIGVWDKIRNREIFAGVPGQGGYLSLFSNFGPGPKTAQEFAEPKDFLWLFGEMGTIGCRAKLADGVIDACGVDVIVSGWKINLGEN